MQRDSALMFTRGLIEYIGRERKLKRSDVVRAMGKDVIERVYRHADVLHSEPIEHVASEYIQLARIPVGSFDNIGACRYEAPDFWAIGEVYERLVEDAPCNGPIEGIIEVYTSWIDDAISNYNSDFFYQPRYYLRECYLAGKPL